MAVQLTTETISSYLSFPFKSPKAGVKLLIGSLLFAAGGFVPVIPVLFVLGYVYEIIQNIQQGQRPDLPEWQDWGRLISNGFKYFGVSFIYTLPVAVLYTCGLSSYILPFFGMTASTISGPNFETLSLWQVLMMGGMGIFFITFALSIFLILPLGLGMLVGINNMVHTNSFKAAFQFGKLWRLFKANTGAWAAGFVVLLGLSMAYMLAYMFLSYTVILCFLVPFVGIFFSFYILLVASALFADIYQDSLEKLGEGTPDINPLAGELTPAG